MKTILSSRRRHYLARASHFLILVALIAGMVGCVEGDGGGGGVEYNLIISSTEGGSVIEPGEGTYTYAAGTVRLLAAIPDPGYHFVKWTGDVGTIVDVNTAISAINMSGNYSITANFAFGPQYIPGVAAGWVHTVGLCSNGTVIATGDNSEHQCDVTGWTDIVQVAAGS
jgi:uncharacterized repeat protein (TIGR02543 family)